MGLDIRDLTDFQDEFTRRRRPEGSASAPAEETRTVLDIVPTLSTPGRPISEGTRFVDLPPGPRIPERPDPFGVPLAHDQRVRTPVVRDPRTGLIQTEGPTLPALPPPLSEELIFTDPATRMLEEFTRRRFRELQQPAFTPTEENVRRAGVFDELERQRQMAKRQAVERIATMGHARTSGIFEDADRLIDEQFNRMRSERERDLFLEGIGRRDRQQREALALATLLPELVERRLQLATGTLTGAAPSPGSIFQQISQMVGQTHQQEALESQRRGSSMGGLGQIIGLLLSGGFKL